MPFTHLEDSDFNGKGISGQPDVPGISGAEMRAKVEELVRDVVKNKINEIVDAITDELATKQELAEAIIEAGSVRSVFGRKGTITAQAGDYTAAQVGAAPSVHASRHGTNGADPITPTAIGAATNTHVHGNITTDGKIGAVNGKVIMTGVNGTLTAVDKENTGLLVNPTETGSSGAINVTLETNKEYQFTNVTSLILAKGTADYCYGIVHFGTITGAINLTGFSHIGGDDYTEMASNETWEFSLWEGNLLWKNWGV